MTPSSQRLGTPHPLMGQSRNGRGADAGEKTSGSVTPCSWYNEEEGSSKGPDKIKPESSRSLYVQDAKLLATLGLRLAVNWSLGCIVSELPEAERALGEDFILEGSSPGVV